MVEKLYGDVIENVNRRISEELNVISKINAVYWDESKSVVPVFASFI